MADDPEFSDDGSAIEDDDESYLEAYFPSYRWSREHVTSDALDFAAKIAAASAEYLATMSIRAKAENNFLVDQEDASNQAREAIESITKTPTQGGPDA